MVNPIRQATVRVSTSAGDFRDMHPFVGPAVFISSALYFVVQIVVAWVFTPSYNLIHNTISDLGNTSCGTYGGVPVCSPRHLLMNVTFCLLGVVMAVGSLLIYQEFTEHPKPQKIAARIGFTLMALGWTRHDLRRCLSGEHGRGHAHTRRRIGHRGRESLHPDTRRGARPAGLVAQEHAVLQRRSPAPPPCFLPRTDTSVSERARPSGSRPTPKPSG